MKKLIMHNLVLKIVSLLLAIILWVVIINLQDPVEEKTFRNVPIVLENQDKVTQREKIPEFAGKDTVDVVLEGRRSELEEIQVSDIHAVADLEMVSFMDNVIVTASVPKYPSVKVTNNNENMVKLIFDDYVTQKYSFTVKTTGTVSDGFVVGDALASPNIIQISGAKTVLDKIKEVVLDVDVAGRNADFTTSAVPFVYDKNGDAIDSTKIKMNMSNVSVMVPILSTKYVSIRVETVGTPMEGYEVQMQNIAFQPERVLIAGKKEELMKVPSTLSLKVDVTDKTGTIEENIRVEDIIDPSLNTVRTVENGVIAVTVKVTPLENIRLDIPFEQLELRNLEEGYEASLLQETPIALNLKAKASRTVLASVEALKPYLDFEGIEIKEGEADVPLMYELPTGIFCTETPTVHVVLSRANTTEHSKLPFYR